MNKNELIGAVASSAGISKTQASDAVEAVFGSISGELSSGGEVRLVGFGIPITLIDKSPQVSDDIRASTIHPPSLEMMEPYGITDEILKTGIKVRQWQIRNHTTGDKVIFDLDNISDETDYPYRVQFEQSKICMIMDRKLRASPLAEVRYGTEFLSLTEHSDGIAIDVKTNQGQEKIFGQFLIAADGGNSPVREYLGLAFEGSTYPEKTVLVTTPFPFHEHIESLPFVILLSIRSTLPPAASTKSFPAAISHKLITSSIYASRRPHAIYASAKAALPIILDFLTLVEIFLYLSNPASSASLLLEKPTVTTASDIFDL